MKYSCVHCDWTRRYQPNAAWLFLARQHDIKGAFTQTDSNSVTNCIQVKNRAPCRSLFTDTGKNRWV
jgi:hypothetical protein